MAVKVQLRRGTAAQWAAANPVLAEGEVGLEFDTAKHKVGDGVTAWAGLSYAAVSDATVAAKGSIQLTGDLGGTASAPVVQMATYTTATLPTPSAAWVGRPPVVLRDPGSDGQLMACLPRADGSFAWIVIAF